NFLFLFSVFTFITSIYAFKELEEYTELKKTLDEFNSLTSPPATLFSVYLNSTENDIDSRYKFINDLQLNMEKIRNFGAFPYNPKGKVDQNEYKALEKRVNENRQTISNHFGAIDNSLKYVVDILSRYQYMTEDDKKAQSETVIKHILGLTVLPEESLPTRLPILSGADCMNWIDSELQLLVFQFENNDPSNIVDFEEYSKINLSQCLNYIGTGYSMLISAKQANGDADATEFFERYNIGVSELISNHEASIQKKSFQSARKAAILDEEAEAFALSKVISFIFIIAQLMIMLLF
ncbi:hypothetical protein LY90DRAFT_698798, partial [Neocallimastix californiae]